MLHEANNNGIPATNDINDSQFKMAKRILITTAHKLFNGLSAFKKLMDQGIRLGRIVTDDAQTTMQIIRNQFVVKVDSESELYKQLLTLFEDDIRIQEPMMYVRLTQRDDSCQYLEVPPKAIWEKRDEVSALLFQHKKEEGVLFSLPLIDTTLAFSAITFSSGCVEIAAPCPDVNVLDAYHKAVGHVFLSATYSNIDDLIVDMAVNEESILPIISPESASDCGDRMILSTHAINPRLVDNDIYTFVAQIAKGKRLSHFGGLNIVVLVSSESRAKQWQSVTGGRIAVRDEVETAVFELCSGDYSGVLIVVNRYDGIDLPGDACRLLILDGIAGHFAGRNYRRAKALYNTPVHYASIAHKMEQGIGRGIRGEDDYCAVLLIGGELEMATHKRDRINLLSPVLQRQLELSHQIESQIAEEDDTLEGIEEALELFLARDTVWDALRSEALSDAVYSSDWTYDEVSVSRREAFRLACDGNFRQAAYILRRGIDAVDNDEERGWFMEELSRYVQQYDGNQSQTILAKAHSLNSVVVKPQSFDPSPSNKVRHAQAVRIVSNTARCSNHDDVIDEICPDINGFAWGKIGNAEKDEQIIKQVGEAIGFISSRPEKEKNNGGPDNLWLIPLSCAFSIELKADVNRPNPDINKDEISQTHSSLDWTKKQHPDLQAIPVIIHPANTLTEKATPPHGLRVINKQQLSSLFESIRRFAEQVAQGERWRFEQEVEQALVDNHLVGKDVVMRFSSPVE